MEKVNVAIIGGGIIGITIAEEFLRRGVKNVILLEKNNRLMLETSSHNSGLIHGGFDATSGTLKAKFNVEGRHIFEEKYFKKESNFSFTKINSIILAYNDEDIKELDELFIKGLKNGLKEEEMKIISSEEIFKIDPNISNKVKKGLICYSSWVINPVEFAHFLYEKALKLHLKIHTGFKVTKIEKIANNKILLESENKDEIEADFVINASGVWAEEIAKLVEIKPDFTIKTRRGQYLILDKTQAKKISNNVFFLTPSKHGKGVLIAPQFDGRVLVGPTAEDNVSLDDIQLVTEEGLSKVKEIGKKINPHLDFSRVETVMAGSRPINSLINDYFIGKSNTLSNLFHVAGTQSPALSGSVAISKYVYDQYKLLVK